MKKLLFFVLTLGFSSYSLAGYQSGIISHLWIHSTPDENVQMVGVAFATASTSETMEWCTTRQEWAIDLIDATEADKMQFAMLLSAYHAGKEVRIDEDPKEHSEAERCFRSFNRVRNVRYL